jgi:signal transduction histidine kinase
MRFQIKLLVLFLLLFILSASLLFLFYNQIKHEITVAVQQDLENVIHSVHYSSQKLSNEKMPDQSFLKTFIDSVKNNSKIQEISIVGNNNQIVASSNPHKVGKHQLVNDQIVVVKEIFGREDSIGKHERYQVTIPIEREKKLVGLIQTSIVVNNVDSMMDNLFMKDAIIAVITLFLLFIIFYEVLRRLNHPVSLLVRASKRIAEGETYVQVQYKKKGELSNLVQAFNLMASRIEAQRVIETQYRDLERRAILSETAATLAHEIRNPLNCINLTVDVLIDSIAAGGGNESDRELLVNVKHEVQRLNKMVTDFLAMGKPMPLSMSTFTLRDLADEVHLLIKRQLIDKKIEMLIDIGNQQDIHADREQIRLVLLNLLLNAVAATEKSGQILLSVECVEADIIIRVSDNGSGINESDLQKVFEPYFTTKADGAGLGLALVKRIVEEHNGSISALNNPSRGVTFKITIPNAKEKHG